MLKLITIFLLTLPSLTLAQSEIERSVIATAGAESQQGNQSLSWTLGEIMTETYTQGESEVTSGFQQDHYIIITSVVELTVAMKVYPNPTSTSIYIELDNSEPLIATLYTVTGSILLTKMIAPNIKQEEIPMTDFPAGNYFLKIVNEGGQHQIFKLQKIQI